MFLFFCCMHKFRGKNNMFINHFHRTPFLRNLGHDKGICPECCAGRLQYPFEDIRRNPGWKSSIGTELPWAVGNESPLVQIPTQENAPHLFFRKDPFHIWKQSIGGHWIASSIVLLMDLKYFGPGSVEYLMDVAYADYEYFVKKEWHGTLASKALS